MPPELTLVSPSWKPFPFRKIPSGPPVSPGALSSDLDGSFCFLWQMNIRAPSPVWVNGGGGEAKGQMGEVGQVVRLHGDIG